MSRRLPLLVLIALIVFAFLWFGRSRDEAPVERPDQAVVPPQPQTQSAVPPPMPRVLETPEAVTRETVLEAEPAAAVESKRPICIVLGRAADENDQPLAGVMVQLFAYKVWTEGVDVPRLPGERDLRGFEMTTAADGKFRFETPVPTAESLWLTLEPDPFHDSARKILGGKRQDAPPLHAGENDFGTIRLVSTGAIRGSVRDESGAPIAGAKLVLGPERSQTLGREGVSDAAGNFMVGHSPAGTMGLNAKAEGYLSEFRKPIDVELARFTDHVDFVLRKAPSLSGIVVDDTGSSIEGARLFGWPKSSGAGAGAKSLADGSFTIWLPQDEPYTLEATRDGFASFGVNDDSKHYPPGTRDLRIVLARLDSSTLIVIDAVTEQPITKFGHEVLPNESSHSLSNTHTELRSPAGVDHPDGRVNVAFRPGIDVVDVGAHGYEPRRFDPKPDEPHDGGYVVKLTRNASVFGRVQAAGVPTGGVALRLEAGRREGPRGGEPGPLRFIAQRDGTTLLTSAADGSFRFENTPRGGYRLIARAPSGEVACVNDIQVKAGSTVDLGTIELVQGATVRGLVLVPAGRRAGGLTVRIDNANSGESQVTDDEGRFRFEALAAGAHQFFLPDASGLVSQVPPVDVELAVSEVRDVQIDAREFGTCSIDLTILIGGRPAANAQVGLTRPGEKSKRIELGSTNSEGRVVASAPLAKGLGLSLWTADRTLVNHPTAKFDLTLDAKIVETIRFATATVEIVLPGTLILPAQCTLRFELATPGDAMAIPATRYISLADGVTQDGGVTSSEGGHRLRFADALAGDWQLTVDVSDMADPMEKVQLSPNSWRSQRKTMYSATRVLKLEAGQTAVVELR
ncbi:MAG TPA: carboxypeptidase-like regulatory domain-containing protein [Planctomycetota bacterium]|nr:carboxypeptidase-like regulatory domain-containing protein [Planctomycetota bacterium]